MDLLWWFLVLALMLIGLAGTLLPLVPGTILILCGAVVNYFALNTIGWPTLVAMTVLMILSPGC